LSFLLALGGRFIEKVCEVIVVLLISLTILAGLVVAIWSADEDQQQRERRIARDLDMKRKPGEGF
jgi:hypothetical protein